MKTTPDGWPVYEDTRERIEVGDKLWLLRTNEGGTFPSHERVSGITLEEHAKVYFDHRVGHVSGRWVSNRPDDYDHSEFFRHPHNAAAAWLKAVSGEETK